MELFSRVFVARNVVFFLEVYISGVRQYVSRVEAASNEPNLMMLSLEAHVNLEHERKNMVARVSARNNWRVGHLAVQKHTQNAPFNVLDVEKAHPHIFSPI